MDLTTLKDDELRALHARVGALLESKRAEGDEQLLFTAIAQQLDAKGQTWSLGMLARNALYTQFQSRCLATTIYVDRFFQPKNRLERLKAFRLLTRVLLRFLENARVPITLKTVVQNLDKIPRLVDDEFPGYLESGVLPMLLQRQARISKAGDPQGSE